MSVNHLLILLLVVAGDVGAAPFTDFIGYFWHLTDVHYDANYSIHGNPMDMCHLPSSGIWNSSSTLGEFGDYLCDSPWALVEQAIEGMKALYPDPDFILWTGDSVPHVNNSILDMEKIFGDIANVTEALRTYFPNTSIYPLLGNHDVHPSGQMPNGGDFYSQILAATGWINLLLPDQQQQFRTGGYYSVPLGKTTHLICLNTNLYYTADKLTPNVVDPSGQFAWLRSQLAKAMSDEHKVHIAAHMPPGGCERVPGLFWFDPQFNDDYLKLMEEYSSIILSHFYGHEHSDTFRIQYRNKVVPVTAMYLSPSLTPYKGKVYGESPNNPGIRLYMYRKDTGLILDYRQYYLNLTEANMLGKAKWDLEYQATKAYKLVDITPSSLETLIHEFQQPGTDFFQTYLTYNAVSYDNGSECNITCQRNHLCSITCLDHDDYNACMKETTTSSTTTITPSTVPSTRSPHHDYKVPEFMFYIVGGLSGTIILMAVIVSCLCLRKHPASLKYSRFRTPSTTVINN